MLLAVTSEARLSHPFRVVRSWGFTVRSGLHTLVVEPSAHSCAAWLLIALACAVGDPSNSHHFLACLCHQKRQHNQVAALLQTEFAYSVRLVR